jgi:hypothetical protein
MGHHHVARLNLPPGTRRSLLHAFLALAAGAVVGAVLAGGAGAAVFGAAALVAALLVARFRRS